MEWLSQFPCETRLHTGFRDVWIKCNYKLTMISEPGEQRNCSQLNAKATVIQQRNEPWNARPNFLAILNFIPALAMSE
jgi:hypothetical protein